MLEMPELCDNCQGKLLTESETRPRERSVLQSRSLKNGDLKNILTLDLEMRGLAFVINLPLIMNFPNIFPFLHLGMVMYIPYHYMF